MKKSEADMGYQGKLYTIRHPRIYISRSNRKVKAIVRARHETISRIMKQFNFLKQNYRHDLAKHGIIFQAVAVITHILFDCGRKPIKCKY